MKRIMILGASILQLPAIQKAKEMGLQVIAVDMDKNAIGFKYADICLEISTLDISRVVKAARKYNIDGIMTLASDLPIRTVAVVSRELNIIGINEDTALKATNKALMRQCLKEHGVPVPRFYCVSDFDTYQSAIQHFNGKFIVKPADNSGSRGVYLIEKKEDIAFAFEYSKKYSRDGEIVIEEYMEGPEVSVESISIDGEVHIIQFTDKLTTGSPNFVEMGHSQPTRHSKEIKRQIGHVVAEAVSAIGIKNGPAHTEIIITREGPKIVELGARLGGDNITTHLVPLSTGVDMVRSCIEIALGFYTGIKSKHCKGSAIRYFKALPGKIKDIQGVDKASQVLGVKQISLMKSVGDTIGEINSSGDRIGFVITQADNPDTAIKICEDVIKIIDIGVC